MELNESQTVFLDLSRSFSPHCVAIIHRGVAAVRRYMAFGCVCVRGRDMAPFKCVFLELVSKVSQPTVTEEKWKDSDLLNVEYISLSVDPVYSGFLYRHGARVWSVYTQLGRPRHYISTRMEIKAFKCRNTEDPLCPLFDVAFIYSWKRQKQRMEKKKTLWEEKVESSCLWEVVAVFLCTFVFAFDVISISMSSSLWKQE